MTEPNQITFSADGNDWFLRIDEDGIHFNRERYPNSQPDEFAEAFMHLMERKFEVKFTKKLEPKEWKDTEL